MADRSIPKDAAYQIISDELMLDGNPRLNLASFVTTWMEPECDKLMMQAINKNYVDMDEYPITTELQVMAARVMIFGFSNLSISESPFRICFGCLGFHLFIFLSFLHFYLKVLSAFMCLELVKNRCVNIIGNLFNAPLKDGEEAVGVGTVGSSEAIMLAGLAFKRKWQNKRKAQGKPYDKPNIVTGANVQVALRF